jgi:hypothetical protein
MCVNGRVHARLCVYMDVDVRASKVSVELVNVFFIFLLSV